VILGISCSDDFLLQNDKNLYLLSDTLFLHNNQKNVETSLQIPDLSNSEYTIFMQPKWLSFDSMHGRITGGKLSFTCSIVNEYVASGYQTQYGIIIIDVETIGLISFIVSCTNYGSPTIQCSVSSLIFESSNSQTIKIRNTTEGYLNWEITGIPEWLIIIPSSGSLYKDFSTTITVSLNFDKITSQQDLSALLQINSNSITGGFTLEVHVPAESTIPPEIIKINGIVTDAEFNHESGIMAICTKSPNSIIVFNTNTNESNTILLDKTPNCVSQSEDGHKAVIGYSVQSVSYFDVDNSEITQDYTINCIPFDIVIGYGGWCYISTSDEQWPYFWNLNLNTGALISCTNWSVGLNYRTIIKKIPAKPYLVGTRTEASPSGIFIFDINKGNTSDTISYYHTSIGKFWISFDGTKLYDSYGKISNLPAYDTHYHIDPPLAYGKIESEYNEITAFDECPAISSIFVNSSYFDFISGYSSLIEQFNTVSLEKIRTFSVSPVFVTENGIKELYETSARYIFVNKEGSKLYVLKNLKENYNKDYWTIETIQLGS
jgi:hypothetical protein